MNTPNPETELPIIGIDLDDIEAFAVWGDGAVKPEGVNGGAKSSAPWNAAAIPPAVVLPRFAGESFDVDLCWPPHPRGLGDIYPPESRVEESSPPGRLPLAYAWAMLGTGADRDWSWRIDDHESLASAHDAIIHVIGEIITRLAGAPDAAIAALVTPVHLPKLSRRRLEETAKRASLQIRFIPRDVAGAYAAMDLAETTEQISPTPQSTGPNWVMTMHLGLTAWEVGAIELNADPETQEFSLDHHSRMVQINGLSSYGLWIFEHIAKRAIEMSYRNCPTHRVWELLWGTPWMRTAIDCAAGGPEGPWPQPLDVLSSHVCRREFIRQQVRQVIPRILSSEGEAPALYKAYLPKTPKSAEFRDWTITTKRALPSYPPIATIATGPLASLPHDDTPIGRRQCKELMPSGPEPKIIGLDLSRDSLAKAAARCAANMGETE